MIATLHQTIFNVISVLLFGTALTWVGPISEYHMVVGAVFKLTVRHLILCVAHLMMNHNEIFLILIGAHLNPVQLYQKNLLKKLIKKVKQNFSIQSCTRYKFRKHQCRFYLKSPFSMIFEPVDIKSHADA